LPTIIENGAIALKVFFSDTMRHKAPHIHVFNGGESIAVVSREPFIGGPLPRRVRRLIDENIEQLWEAWDACNG
jgi:hypothetical protein